MSSILIIASYNGKRRWSPDNNKLLYYQHKYLSKIKHNLDKILIVQNESDCGLPDNLKLFDNVLHRPNVSGSYGAWIDGYLANPGYDWYFFIEDDYIFTLDNFDDKMIELWDENTSYLCSLILIGHIRHAAISNGLTRGDILETLNYSLTFQFEEAYDHRLQYGFSSMFQLPDKDLKDMTEHYRSPFWQLDSLRYMEGDKPILISPVQLVMETENASEE